MRVGTLVSVEACEWVARNYKHIWIGSLGHAIGPLFGLSRLEGRLDNFLWGFDLPLLVLFGDIFLVLDYGKTSKYLACTSFFFFSSLLILS
jgi:hypothetical protein